MQVIRKFLFRRSSWRNWDWFDHVMYLQMAAPSLFSSMAEMVAGLEFVVNDALPFVLWTEEGSGVCGMIVIEISSQTIWWESQASVTFWRNRSI